MSSKYKVYWIYKYILQQGERGAGGGEEMRKVMSMPELDCTVGFLYAKLTL